MVTNILRHRRTSGMAAHGELQPGASDAVEWHDRIDPAGRRNRISEQAC